MTHASSSRRSIRSSIRNNPPRPIAFYRRLWRRFGPQGWWPVSPPNGIRPRYRLGHYGAPNEREALEIAVGAILTQNTAWSNVERAIESLHADSALELSVLSSMPSERLERLIRSSGYFRQKTKRLKTFVARAIARGGMTNWMRASFAELREELLSLSGVGPETADSIILYAGAKPAFVVDAYTLRIGERLGWYSRATYAEAQNLLVQELPRSVTLYQEFHALVVTLAKLYCRKEPLCGHCPMAEDCRFALEHRR